MELWGYLSHDLLRRKYPLFFYWRLGRLMDGGFWVFKIDTGVLICKTVIPLLPTFYKMYL